MLFKVNVSLKHKSLLQTFPMCLRAISGTWHGSCYVNEFLLLPARPGSPAISASYFVSFFFSFLRELNLRKIWHSFQAFPNFLCNFQTMLIKSFICRAIWSYQLLRSRFHFLSLYKNGTFAQRYSINVQQRLFDW